MAQLKDTIVQGSLNVTNSITTDKLYSTGIRNHAISGTGTAAVAYVAANGDTPATPGKPALWKYNLGISAPANGDMVTIEIPIAGHSNGVFVSLDNGTNYKPVSVKDASRLTTHFAAGHFLTLIYDTNGTTNTVYPVDGATAATNVNGGCWRVVNYYDTNDNTLLRTYALGSSTEVPLLAGSTNTSGAWSNYTSSYKALYGVISNTAANRPMYNPSTGLVKIKSLQLTSALPAGSGGTGHTSLINAANALINALGEGTSTLTANDYVITQYVGGGSSTITYHRRPASAVVNATLVKAALGTDGSTTSQYLNKAGNWAALPTATTAALGVMKVGTGLSVSSGTVSQTAHTFTIGNTSRNYNGSANVSWTLAEIGAAASSHTHNYAAASHTHAYLSTSGGTLTGDLYINKATDVGGTNSNGSLVIGIKAGANIGIDPDEIHARNNNAVSTLYLNYEGGSIAALDAGTSYFVNIRSTKDSTAVSNGALVIGGGIGVGKNLCIGGNIYLAAGKHIYMNYNNTSYDVLFNHNNGNVSLRAAGGGLYLGYENTTLINFLNGLGQWTASTSSLTVNGTVNATTFIGALTGNASSATRINGNLTAQSGNVNANIWVSDGTPTGIPKYISGFYINPGTKAMVVPASIIINQPADARSNGIIGTYDHTKAAAIWSMGTSYQIAADGSGLGTLYGAAYGYQGQTYIGGNTYAGGHQFLWCENGTVKVALGQNIWTAGSVTAGSHITTGSNRYTGPGGSYGLNLRNSDIIGANGIFTADAAESFSEGLNFYRDATHADAMAAANGTFYFARYTTTNPTTSAISLSAINKQTDNSLYGAELVAHRFNGYSCVARYSTQGSGTDGSYAVVRVKAKQAWMMAFTVRIYASYVRRDYKVTGYNYSATGKWHIPTVFCEGMADVATSHNVLFGRSSNSTGVYNELWVAFPLNSTLGYQYPTIEVLTATNAYVEVNPYFEITVGSVPTNYFDSVPCYVRVWHKGESITGAVWNDYAEYRQSYCEEPGYVVYENGDDTLSKTTERLQHFAGIVSDTWGFCQGETELAKTPIAVSGRVLAYTYKDRNLYQPGDCVCAAPDGTVDIMTREEIIQYPDRVVGTVSCVPDYEEWGNGDRPAVKIDGRIWIKVR